MEEEKKFVTADELEAARLEVLRLGGGHKKAASRLGAAAIVVFLVLFAFGIFTFSTEEEFRIPGIIICVIMFIGCFVLMTLSSKEQGKYIEFLNPYNTMYKTQFLPSIMQESFDKVYAFEPQNGLSREVVISSGIFPTFDFITTNDYLRASYDGLNFEYCDLELQEKHTETDSDGDTRTVIDTMFIGVFIIVEFDHFVNTPLYIRDGGGKGTVTTESEVFNRNFSVKCENDIDALRILTPEMMDYILKIKEFCKNSIGIAFFDDKIFFCANLGGDRFEIAGNIEQPISESRKKVDEDIAFLKELLDILRMRNLKSRSSQRTTINEDFASHAAYQNEHRD
jgi:hypothetical protein